MSARQLLKVLRTKCGFRRRSIDGPTPRPSARSPSGRSRTMSAMSYRIARSLSLPKPSSSAANMIGIASLSATLDRASTPPRSTPQRRRAMVAWNSLSGQMRPAPKLINNPENRQSATIAPAWTRWREVELTPSAAAWGSASALPSEPSTRSPSRARTSVASGATGAETWKRKSARPSPT